VRHHITIADVAREAGVSRQTVSRVINAKGEISETTCRRVQAVIERLGYRPNSIARSLATQRTFTLGVIVPDIANPFFAEVVRGAEEVAHRVGYSILLANSVEDPQREADLLNILEDKQVDGLILCSSRLPDDQLAEHIDRHPSVVLINRRLPQTRVHTVRVDYHQGARQVMAHLFALERHFIGFLAGPLTAYSSGERMQGYREALAEHGQSYDPGLLRFCSPYYDDGCKAAGELLSARPQIDAIICFNDLVTAGALCACRRSGRRVPEDVALAGADDILLASLISPALTTLSVDKRQLGASAMQLLLDEIAGATHGPQDIVIPQTLVLRGSTVSSLAAHGQT
jgi:LacI family transcriptional regulator